MKERNLTIGTPENNYHLIYCRGKETSQILEYLNEHPFVFVYSAAGNGKTTFCIEFKERVPGTALILGAQLGSNEFDGVGLYDSDYEDKKIIIADEFASPCVTSREEIDDLISKGKKFIFMLHYPKSHYVNWRKQHQEFDPLVMGLLKDRPDTPWIHLKKFKEIK